ncbi:hypothetical protein [Halobacillus sp. A5]|uniref:hypothetical protein n=1 Tax=Halobacillus sp. A5 TaxID=2880263 RepID=UPI0020A63267|nr:hypothetical protein [Halobacillus sp. A5]MCP3025398.1 hypothetical protein [Halobacillus sp. A5]
MEKYFNIEELEFIEAKSIELPKENDILNEVLMIVREMYRDFIEKNVKYESYSAEEFGKTYYFIEEVNDFELEHETVQDFVEELTGDKGLNFIPNNYENEIFDLIDETITERIGVENENILLDEEIGSHSECKHNILADILDKPISALKPASNRS